MKKDHSKPVIGIYHEIINVAKPFLDTRYNELHARVAYSFALKLLGAEGGDEAVVLPAVILHDIGWKSVPGELQLEAFGPGRKDRYPFAPTLFIWRSLSPPFRCPTCSR